VASLVSRAPGFIFGEAAELHAERTCSAPLALSAAKPEENQRNITSFQRLQEPRGTIVTDMNQTNLTPLGIGRRISQQSLYRETDLPSELGARPAVSGAKPREGP